MPYYSLSANTLFHFTGSFKTLESILKTEFQPHYCLENLRPLIREDFELEIPMVSFCDIPLSQIYSHVQKYGNYALGLSKDWGVKNKINPVIYVNAGSKLSKSLHDLLKLTIEALGKWASEQENKFMEFDGVPVELLKTIPDCSIIQYIKPYEGKLWRKGNYSDKDIRFYDEREWRYIPQNIIPMLFKMQSLDSKVEKKIISVLKTATLSFEPKDIKYIIVKNNQEALKMAERITDIKGKYPFKEVQLLTTKIISMEQIKEDF